MTGLQVCDRLARSQASFGVHYCASPTNWSRRILFPYYKGLPSFWPSMQTPGMGLLGGLTRWLINPNHPHSYAWIQSRSAVFWPSVRVCKKPLCEWRWIFFANCSLEKVVVNYRFPSFCSSIFTFPSWWTSYLFYTQFSYLIFNHFKFHSSWSKLNFHLW